MGRFGQLRKRRSTRKRVSKPLLPAVLQIGPAPGSSGGIASVIEETLKFNPKEFQQRTYPSWTPEGYLASFPRAWRTAVIMCATTRHWSIAHVHLSEYGSFLREGGLLLVARALRRPAVATLHGANLAQHVERYPQLTRWVFGAATIILCLGEKQAQIVAGISPKTSVRVVANPVDEMTFRSAGIQAQQHDSGPVFLFAGEVGHRKGHDRLAKAWDTILDQYPDAKLRVAGPVANGYKVTSQRNVEYLGNLSRDELLGEMSTATAVVLPSRAEVLPMVLIESHAQGTPTVYTKVGEWSEFDGAPGIRLIDTSGLPERDIIASIADAMLDIATATNFNPDALVDWTRRKFSAPVVSEQLNSAYRDAIGRTRP